MARRYSDERSAGSDAARVTLRFSRGSFRTTRAFAAEDDRSMADYDERRSTKPRETGAHHAPVPKRSGERCDKPAVPGQPLPRLLATRAISGPGEPLPYAELIQHCFGRHDISNVRAYQGAAAREATLQLGARAFAFGCSVVFGSPPSLFTAAHEAAHVVQQRAGRAPEGGLDSPDDALERHADAVAAAVVEGRNVEALLDQLPGESRSVRPAVQRETKVPPPATATQYIEGKHGSFTLAELHKAIAEQLMNLDVVAKSPGGDVLGNSFARQLESEIALDRSTSGTLTRGRKQGSPFCLLTAP